MWRNIPNQYDERKLSQEISDNFNKLYEIVHIPNDKHSNMN